MMGIKIILTFKILHLDSKLSFSVKDIKECWNYFMINKRLKKNKYKKIMSSGAFFTYTKKVQVKHEFLVDAQKIAKITCATNLQL
jgi:hypothetical protein